jgi:hypothetical protein
MSKIKRGPLPTDHFTIVSNDWMRDKRLSFAARGLLAWLAGHADGFDITEAAIIEAGPDGRGAVRTMTEALEKAGYLKRDRTYHVSGGSTVDYILTDPREGNFCLSGEGQEMPLQPGQEEQALFPGQPEGQKMPPRSTTEDQKKNKKTSSSTTKRGTRVPDDFQPTDEMKAWFAAEGLQRLIQGRVEHEKFMDYWRSAPGAKGVKLDWPATWRNWMRTAAERSQGTGYSRPVSAPPGNSLVPAGAVPPVGAYRPSTTDQKVLQTIELGRRLQQQMEEMQ